MHAISLRTVLLGCVLSASFGFALPPSEDAPSEDASSTMASDLAEPMQDRSCGDGRCSPPEDCDTCPRDCGSCCGDHRCAPPEDCHSCPGDCGSCCGDYRCAPPEDCRSCPGDCGSC